MNGKTSQRKGADAEREVVAILQAHGYPAKRGGSLTYGNVPDVYGLDGLHLEIKRHERLNLHAAYQQSQRDAQRFQDGKPVVVHRRSREPWLITLALIDFLEIYDKKKDRLD